KPDVVPNAAPPLITAPAPGPIVLDLAGARRLALEKQPALAAYRASLAAAQAKAHALNNLPAVSNVLAPDLKIRRQQAAIGIQIAEAQLNQGTWDALEAVTRVYWAAVYADVQRTTLDDTLARLRTRRDEAELTWMKDRLEIYIEYVNARRATAVE